MENCCKEALELLELEAFEMAQLLESGNQSSCKREVIAKNCSSSTLHNRNNHETFHISNLWNLESIDIDPEAKNNNDLYEKTMNQINFVKGRHVAKFSWKNIHAYLNDNKAIAGKQSYYLTNKLIKNDEYDNSIRHLFIVLDAHSKNSSRRHFSSINIHLCLRVHGKCAMEPWPVLPSERVATSMLFGTTSLDFASPLYIETEDSTDERKRYLVQPYELLI
uniref:Uncharacterized protein n=1 Tax=Glossina palpalis gambiensis TaxID=67801 RepID=A0A1B0BH82_9MUSC